jgi:hypothetical protein
MASEWSSVEDEGRWSGPRTVGNIVGFVLLMTTFCFLGLSMEYNAISMWWLVAYLLPAAVMVRLQPDWGWGRLRLGLLGDIALPIAALLAIFCWDADDLRSDARSRGHADRIAHEYFRSPQGLQPLLAAADSDTLNLLDTRIPTWIVTAELERRKLEQLDKVAAEKRRRAEAQRRQDEFAATPLGRALGLVFVIGWLLSELVS